jgi:hypothetical protein
MRVFLVSSSNIFLRIEFVSCSAFLSKTAQAFESGGPILLVLRDPGRQRGGQDIGFESIKLLSPATRCRYQARCPKTHQVLGDP